MCKLTFAAVMNYRFFNVETTSEAVGSIGSVIYLIFLATVFIFLWTMALYYWDEISKSKSSDEEIEDIRKKNWKGTHLFYQYRTDHFFHYCYPLYFIMRRFFMSVIFVYWHDQSYYQLLFLSMLSVFSLVWHTTYMPFRSRLRNIIHTIFEFGYLTLCLMLFPYVYPNLTSDRFDKYPIFVITIYGIIFLAGLLTAMIGMYKGLEDKENDIPINEEPAIVVTLGPSPQEVLQAFREGEDVVKTPYYEEDNIDATEESEEAEESEEEKEEEKKEEIAKEQSEAEAEEESSESSSSVESESEEISETSSEDSKKDADKYAETRSIPHADVRLDNNTLQNAVNLAGSKQVSK